MDQGEWQRLLNAVAEIQEWFPEGIAFIGGIAVYAHAAASGMAKFAAMSHDADFMISLPDFADLRDVEVLTPNRRLGKQQFSKAGFEFDVYVEGQHGLPIPADEAIAASELRSDLRVACAEHLLILKLKAYEDRKGSSKGEKDEDDLIRLLLLHNTWRSELLVRITDEMRTLLASVVTRDSVIRLSGGNLHEARELRVKTQNSLAAIEKAHEANYGAGNHAS